VEHTFELYTPDGKTVERYPFVQEKQMLQESILQRLQSESWYRLRYHVCRNQERKPCEHWYIVAEHGDVPEDNE
jgi:hypothetical protein